MDTQQFIKSEYDINSYDKLVLDNGLEVLLIENKSTKKSCTSMIVGAGSFMDGDVFGLAHLLEHMLFHGNAKYESGDNYFEFINSHGGYTNAFTDTTNTCYYYTIDNKYLAESTDMFANFFIKPLFDDKMVTKEIDIIDSEYHKDINSVSYQYRTAIKLLAHKNHPFREFDVGSHSTLMRKDIRNKLIDFFTKYYIPQNMKLIILYNSAVSNICDILLPYAQIGNDATKYIQKNVFGCPFEPGKIIRFVPNSNGSDVLLLWTIRYDNDYNKFKMMRYIYYLLGRESQNSLIHILLNNSLADKLHVQTIANFGDYLVMCIRISITDYGYDNLDVVVSMVCKYIEKLRDVGFDETHFKSYNMCTKLDFTFGEQMDAYDNVEQIMTYVCSYGASLCDAATMLQLTHIKDKQGVYESILNTMHNDKLNMVIGSHKCEIMTHERDASFLFKYSVGWNIFKCVNLTFLFDDMFRFDKSFIPKKIMVHTHNKPSNELRLVDETHNIWYNFVNSRIPKVCVIMEFDLGEICGDITGYIGLNLCVNMIKIKLRESLYDAILCGTTYSTYLDKDKLGIKLYGFCDIMNHIIEVVSKCIMCYSSLPPCTSNRYETSNIHNAYFIHVKREYTTFLENKKIRQPHEMIHNIVDDIMYVSTYTAQQQLDMIHHVNMENVMQMNVRLSEIIKSCRPLSKYLISGNISRVACDRISDAIKKSFCKDLQKWQIGRSMMMTQSNGLHAIRTKPQREYIRHTNNPSSLCMFIFCIKSLPMTDVSFVEYHSLSLVVAKMLSDKFFTKMRTDKQLGYIVRNDTDLIGRDIVWIIQKYYIQSSKYSSDELCEYMNEFITTTKQWIISISHNDVLTYIDACISDVTSETEALRDRTTKIFDRIIMNVNYFKYNDLLVNALKNIDNKMIIDFYDRYFISEKREKIIVKICK